MGVDNSTALKQVSLIINEPSLTQLGSWRLTAVVNVTVATWIGHAAAVLSGTWGAVTRRAHQSGSSRTTVYTHAQRVWSKPSRAHRLVGSVTTPYGTKTSGSRPKTPRCGKRGLKLRSSVRLSNAPSRAQAVRWACVSARSSRCEQ